MAINIKIPCTESEADFYVNHLAEVAAEESASDYYGEIERYESLAVSIAEVPDHPFYGSVAQRCEGSGGYWHEYSRYMAMLYNESGREQAKEEIKKELMERRR